MVDGEGDPPGSCLRQPSGFVGVGLGGQLDLLLASGTHPPAEPLRRKIGLQGTKPPRARPDENVGPQLTELVDGERNSIRAEEAASGRCTALVGIKCGGDAAIQGIRRNHLDATDHR